MHTDRAATTRASGIIRLAVLFGTFYFVQGLADPTSGLMAQPGQSLLRHWGQTPEQIATFWAILELPWCLKPLYGLLSDFVPLLGFRRKSYLLVSSALALIGFVALYFVPLTPAMGSGLLGYLIVPALAVTFASVVIDALLIDFGQPTGITGQLQSVQWGSVYTASLLTGVAGGWLSEGHHQQIGFLVCAVMMAVAFALSATFVREPVVPKNRAGGLKLALGSLKAAGRSTTVWIVAGLLFVWHFNAFCNAVLYVHLTNTLHFSDEFYGTLLSLQAVGSILACVAYGYYCRRVPLVALAHLCAVADIVSTLLFWNVDGRMWTAGVSLVFGFTYMTGSLILIDLAARACPRFSAGTVFATFMAIANLSALCSTFLGGQIYGWGLRNWGGHTALNLVLIAGVSTTAISWIFVFFLPKSIIEDVQSRLAKPAEQPQPTPRPRPQLEPVLAYETRIEGRPRTSLVLQGETPHSAPHLSTAS